MSTKSRTLNVRIPPGVRTTSGSGWPNRASPVATAAHAGDLYVRVHVTPHAVFGRTGNDLTLTVPVTFSELALGTTLTVPTLDGKVNVKVPGGHGVAARCCGCAARASPSVTASSATCW